MTDVFVSGPMFSVADKAQQLSIAHALEEAGFSTIVPHRDGIEVGPVLDLLNDPNVSVLIESVVVERCIAWVTKAIACLDIYWAATCKSTVYNIDGRVPDEGGLVEGTVAWANGRPVILYQTTPIRELGRNNNPMIGVISFWTGVAHSEAEVVEAVRWALTTSAPCECPAIDRVVAAGRHVAALRAWPLSSCPLSLLDVIEPDRVLHDMCRFVLRTIVEYSEADVPEVRTKILLDGIDGLKSWTDEVEVSKALASPLPC